MFELKFRRTVKMKLNDIDIKIIQDSRGKDTLEAEFKGGKFSVIASVPSGKSTGTHEAFVLEPKKATQKFGEIRNEILGKEFESQEEFDNFLIQLDGTHSARASTEPSRMSSGQALKNNLGGNLILSLSLAFARLKAKSEKLELFDYISRQSSVVGRKSENWLKPIFNVINGGAHVNSKLAEGRKNKLDFQEFQIVPEVKDFGMALGLGQEFYKKLKEFLENKFGKENVLLGDEAGFCAPFQNNEEAIEILAELIAKHNYPLRIGLDVAATQMYQVSSDKYQVDGGEYSAEKLRDFYLKLIESYNILSIEDPFYEESFEDFTILSHVIVPKGVMIITDDLTTTNPERLRTAIEKKSGNAILIKPNQIGTLTETLKVIKLAYENNWQAVVSHRSGETMDDFIADLAVSVGAWGIKAGAPAAPERMAKYNRVLEINSKFQAPNSK